MDGCQAQMQVLAEQFQLCQKTLASIGDPTRQQVLLALLSGDYNGSRVGEVAAKSHLSRPSVSHHLKILKDVGLISVRQEGRKHYYYFDSNQPLWAELLSLFQLANSLVAQAAENRLSQKEENIWTS